MATTTKLPDSTVIHEEPAARAWARETVAEYRARQRVAATTVRESGSHRLWLPEIVAAFMAAEVIRPAAGEIARRLYESKGL